MTAFALNLRRLMAEQQWTRKALAARLGVSLVTIRHWRAGRFEPGMTHALALARVLGTSVEGLAGARTLAEEERAAATFAAGWRNEVQFQGDNRKNHLPREEFVPMPPWAESN